MAQELLSEIVLSDPGLHSAVEVPDTYWPAADWLIVFTTGLRQFEYDLAIVLDDDEIVAVAKASCANGAIERVYPPAYLVPPPPLVGPVPEWRRSGIAIVDEVLDALEDSDPAQLRALVRYAESACEEGTSEDLHVYLPCLDDEAPGTVGLRVGVPTCHGDYYRPEQFEESLHRLIDARLHLHSVSAVAGSFFSPNEFWPDGRYVVTLATSPHVGTALILSEAGIVGTWVGCGNYHPTDFNRAPPAEPVFLLSPP